MTLRTRILLGYGFLVSLLVLSAFGAALGFHQLGNSIGKVLTDNVASMEAVTAMLEALERQDSALLAALLGEGPAEVSTSESAFRSALAQARANITLPEEPAILADIENRFAAYRTARDSLLATRPQHPLAAYEAETFPAFEAVKTRVLDLLEANHHAMVEADRAAQASAARRAVLHGVLVTVALLALALVSRAMGRDILEPLTDLRNVAQAIADGDRRRRASAATRTDELGVVARQLNAMLDAQQSLEGRMQGVLGQQRLLLLGLLEDLATPAVVVALDGLVVASTADEASTRAVEAAARHVRGQPTGAGAPRQVEIAGAGRMVTFRLLRSGGDRPAGWLATVAAADQDEPPSGSGQSQTIPGTS